MSSSEEALIRAGFTDLAKRRIAKAVGYAESKGYTDAVGDISLVDGKWGPSIGWFQIRSLRDPLGFSAADRYRYAWALRHLDFNATAAFVISKEGTDFTPWSAFKSGSYEQYLDLDYELRTGHSRAADWSM